MPHTPLQRILYVEDDEALARLLQKRMERKGFNVSLALSAETGLRLMQNESYDLILIDYNLPGMNGIEMLDLLIQGQNSPPVIILTASGDEEIALAALEKGAADYAVKDTGQTYLELLPAIMQAAYTRERLMRENERQRHELLIAKENAEAASQAKSNFLATMSHEIRTPMNVVTGLARMLRKTHLSEDQFKIVHTLESNADLLLKLINDLLDISRIEAGQFELESVSFTFASILEDIRLMFSTSMHEKKLSYSVIDSTAGNVFKGDRARIQQVIMNLMSNAVKFTEKGGIEIILEQHNNVDAYEISVSIRDSGIGITPEKLSTIFDKFTQADETITRRFGGSGLGLSIAKSLATLMGGDIIAQTKLDKGSTFTLVLTLEQGSASDLKPINTSVKRSQPSPSSGGTILLVEDYTPNIMVASMMLEDLGFAVVSAEDGLTAIDTVKNSPIPFLAILMDVQMHHIDGLETTRRIREIEATLGTRHTIIGVTAHALAGDRERCLSAGMDDYISKPIHPDILAAKLAQLSKKAS